MKLHATFALVVAMLASLSVSSAARAAEGSQWFEDKLADAQAKAKELKKPLLIDFTGSDWCGFCIKLDKEVFATAEFAEWAKENVVLLKLDFPARKEQAAEIKKQNKELQAKYGVRGFPTVLFLDPEGKELGRIGGYAPGSGAAKWIDRAKGIVAKQ